MNSKKKLVPSIRFKEFTNDWEQEKLGDISLISTGEGITSSDSVKRGFPIVSGGEFFMGYYNSFNRTKNTITIARAGNAGFVSYITQNFYLNDKCFSLEVKNYINSYFLFNKLKGVENKIKNLKTATSVPTITSSIIKKLIINLPIIYEQNKISNLFNNINHLITLHQRKLTKLENIKKTLLEKMFPSEKQTRPVIRFREFVNDWEQERVKNILNYTRPENYIVSDEHIKDKGKYPVLTANKQFILGFSNNLKTFKKEAIIFDDFTLDSKFVNFEFLVRSSAIKILTNKENKNLFFAFLLININNFENNGHARHYINIVQESKILIPNEKEQNKISNFIQSLNYLITLHQRKLKKIENIKKTLLERMFV